MIGTCYLGNLAISEHTHPKQWNKFRDLRGFRDCRVILGTLGMRWEVSTHPSIWGKFCKIFGKNVCTCKWLWKHQRLNSRTLSLDGGLFVYNKSQQPSLPFLKYSTFVILGTLDMPEHAITQLVKIVVSILNYGGVSVSKKNYGNLNSHSWDSEDLLF